ncbi:DNA/RNA helicase domain-containing protein [Ectobacillus funiculus]|uniref:DNA/RNA helicase domain-containing protein n=1 Tax=Ectobacillus funiculus TaxID=137993 RepID=UPI00101D40FB|nr:DNA/RNA helicase domain-containing protein [Ectobacillus funiculus]
MSRGWKLKISAFLKILDKKDFTDKLGSLGFSVSESQLSAWEDCFIFLKEELNKLSSMQKEATIIFEYKLENGMRPDVLVLTKSTLLVLEFKSGENAGAYIDAHRGQVENYSMRFENYHEYTYKNKLKVKPYIVYTHPNININEDDALYKDNFAPIISKEINDILYDKEDSEWFNSNYEAIPDILNAVDGIFNSSNLPDIMRSKSNIEGVLSSIKDTVDHTENETLNLILVSGDPGAGKTLLGLKIVRDYINQFETSSSALYLSGNGPLVDVLKFQIDEACNKGKEERKTYGEAYVNAVPHYLDPIIKYLQKTEEKLGYGDIKKEKILVFDEAQRAWGKEQMKYKYQLEFSQPEVLLYYLLSSIKKLKSSKTLICLVGDGQEIYRGEEDGINNWVSAIKSKSFKKRKIKIYAPTRYRKILEGTNAIFNDNLYLNSYLRGHGADKFPQWINAVLNNETEGARKLLKSIYDEQRYFPIFVTKSLLKGQEHIRQHVDESLETYGLVTSSFAQYELDKRDKYPLSRKDLGSWYKEKCREFKAYVTEFDSQGLEIDYPVVYWGHDLIKISKKDNWSKGQTFYRKKHTGELYDGLKGYKDPLKILKNIYRVLLTRGRNGLIICIPEDPLLNNTFKYFVEELGVKEIR